MSQENVEIVKRGIDAFNRRDLDGLAELSTPDAEWVTSMGAIEAETFRGREGPKDISHVWVKPGRSSRRSPMTFAISASVS